jgi:hypothetical protein
MESLIAAISGGSLLQVRSASNFSVNYLKSCVIAIKPFICDFDEINGGIMNHTITPQNIAVSQLIDEGDGINQAIVLVDQETPYIVYLNQEQASDLYYQLQRIRNLSVQAALMDVNAEAMRIIQGEVFGDFS